MNGSIASANNATLATVAANYGLKTVVDQRGKDHAAGGRHQGGQRSPGGRHRRGAGLRACKRLQASKAGASALTAYALLSAVDTSSEVDSKGKADTAGVSVDGYTLTLAHLQLDARPRAPLRLPMAPPSSFTGSQSLRS